MAKTALITGITGQDGSYLAELLVREGYRVHGIQRAASTSNTSRIDHLSDDITLHVADLADAAGLLEVLGAVEPDEIYNLAAQSHVALSFLAPVHTADITALGAARLLHGLRALGRIEATRYYQASTSELFGAAERWPQDETVPFRPRSPYAAAKLHAHWLTVQYREGYGLFACNGILFNHESPRRGERFVTRKITRGLARIHTGLQDTLSLGNLDARRDWGHARDYVRAMWRMLQQPEPGDYVVGTGVDHSVREFVEAAWAALGGSVTWRGEGIDEVGVDEGTGRVVVRVEPRFFRPVEVPALRADASKARRVLGWEPSTSFEALVAEMVEHDLERARAERG